MVMSSKRLLSLGDGSFDVYTLRQGIAREISTSWADVGMVCDVAG
jgi:hypothetical protein